MMFDLSSDDSETTPVHASGGEKQQFYTTASRTSGPHHVTKNLGKNSQCTTTKSCPAGTDRSKIESARMSALPPATRTLMEATCPGHGDEKTDAPWQCLADVDWCTMS